MRTPGKFILALAPHEVGIFQRLFVRCLESNKTTYRGMNYVTALLVYICVCKIRYVIKLSFVNLASFICSQATLKYDIISDVN
jgi:hypothetical protein